MPRKPELSAGLMGPRGPNADFTLPYLVTRGLLEGIKDGFQTASDNTFIRFLKSISEYRHAVVIFPDRSEQGSEIRLVFKRVIIVILDEMKSMIGRLPSLKVSLVKTVGNSYLKRC